MTFRPFLPSTRTACLLLCGVFLLPLAGCGQSGGAGGVNPGGAVASDEVEAANKAAQAAYDAEKGKNKKK